MMMRYNSAESKVTRLTVNEKTVLKMLLGDGQVSNIDIGNKLHISSQAVSKIKRKLRSKRIINGHTLNLDYRALGMNTFALVLLKVSPFDSCKCFENENVLRNSIGFYKVFKNDITHIGLFGFSNLEDLDKYFDFLYSEYSEFIKIKDVYTFSMRSFFKHSPNDLFFQIIEEFGKEKSPSPIYINYHIENKVQTNFKKLNDNERKVLKLLLQNNKLTCRGITSELEGENMSVSGVNKIKKRLEEKGIIKNYSIKLNYENLGINILSFIFVSKKRECWDLQDGLSKGASGNPNVIGYYKLNHNSLSVLFCGFRNLRELEHYCKELEIRNGGLLNIEKIYITSPNGIIKNSLADIL